MFTSMQRSKTDNMSSLNLTQRLCVVICCAFLFLFLFIGQTYASFKYVSNADELQKAMDDGVTDIVITKSLRGNFTVPRWVHSIKGQSRDVTITPADESKPVFDVESAAAKNVVRTAETILFFPAAIVHALASEPTAQSLEFSDMTILCGNSVGIDTDYLAKPVTIRNVTFKVIKLPSVNQNSVGCYPSTVTTFIDCAFEGVRECISTCSQSDYRVNITNCTFNNSVMALSVSNYNSHGKVSITRCEGNVGYWTVIHTGSSTTRVFIDQETIDSNPESDFYHKIVEGLSDTDAYNDTQFSSYLENCNSHFSKLSADAKKLVEKEKGKGWDAIRIFAMGELQKGMREIDFQDSGVSPREIKERIDRCLNLYTLLAVAPVSSILSSEGKFDNNLIYNFCADTLSSFVKDKNLIKPIIYSFFYVRELSAFSCASDCISWGNTGIVQEALASPQIVNNTPDKVFRENIHRFQDWLSAWDVARDNMKKLQEAVAHELNMDYAYVSELDKRLRNIYDLGIASCRVAAALVFDLPMDTVFVTNFARVMRETSSSRIIGICRELSPFYSVSQRLCVLNRTNGLRTELMKVWKGKLTETHVFSKDDHSKYDDLVAYVQTDSDLMRDATRLKDFFREWR
ncbi:MAG: hypothetical protein J5974_00580 [Pyramidobacter sp.]|nr:hypothetical protein [Pyramidobacter sp.]